MQEKNQPQDHQALEADGQGFTDYLRQHQGVLQFMVAILLR
jgi:hypothetical protein